MVERGQVHLGGALAQGGGGRQWATRVGRASAGGGAASRVVDGSSLPGHVGLAGAPALVLRRSTSRPLGRLWSRQAAATAVM